MTQTTEENYKLGEAYLIFVISFTQAGFLIPNFLHPKISTKTPKSVKHAIFGAQSVKFYT